MCGIAGIIDRDGIRPDVLKSMVSTIRHRGPDRYGIKILDNVGLGHARLSIIDLSESGSQPMANEDGTVFLTYNGEFYTFEQHKDALRKKGHVFKSNTDTEVIIHLYEEYGDDVVSYLRGMFSFALYDSNKKRLLLARDRVGIKPLYYHYDDKRLIFASEIKAILKWPGIDTEMDHHALSAFFQFGNIPGDRSIYRNIKKLPPASIMIYENYELKIRSYWSLPERITPIEEGDAIARLDQLVNESVKMRMLSDVPLGVLLSGGVDSSLVAAVMAKHSDRPIKTFSISFDNSKYDEIEHAHKVADFIGSEHHECVVDLEKSEILDELMYFFDEPFADSSAIPTYFVSKMAKEHVTVALSGDGGDELFGGYNWYDWMLKKAQYDGLPLFLRKAVGHLANVMPGQFKGKHFLSVMGFNEFETFIERTSLFTRVELKRLLKGSESDEFLRQYEQFYHQSGVTMLQRLCRTDFHHYLPDDVLTKVDRASMAVSLEARVPLLDHKICKFAFSLPDELKVRKGVRKFILKEVAKKYMPPHFDFVRKQGFSVPQSDWLKNRYGYKILALLENDDKLDRHYVKELVEEHTQGRKCNSKKLWPILIYLLWKNSE